MDFFIWLIADILLFVGLFLAIFPEKVLEYDSKRIPNFWDHFHRRDKMLIKWENRKRFTRWIGVVFIVAGFFIFWSIYNLAYIKFA